MFVCMLVSMACDGIETRVLNLQNIMQVTQLSVALRAS
jgi:hypothetical protein